MATTTTFLDPTHGLGAVKWLLDPLEVSIVRHEYRGVNYVFLRKGKRGRVKRFKLHTTSRLHGNNALFGVRNFLRDDRPEQYLFTSFGSKPRAWTATAQELTEVYMYLRKYGGLPPGEGGAVLDRAALKYAAPQGALRLSLHINHPWRVKSIEDLNL